MSENLFSEKLNFWLKFFGKKYFDSVDNFGVLSKGVLNFVWLMKESELFGLIFVFDIEETEYGIKKWLFSLLLVLLALFLFEENNFLAVE